MRKKTESKTKDRAQLIKICLMDDSASSGKDIEQLLRLNAADHFRVVIWRTSSAADLSEHWKDFAPFDLILVDISFETHHRPSDQPAKKSFLDDLLTPQHKTPTIFYSKFLPDTWSIARLKDKADVLCVGPDAQQNVRLVAKRALQAMFDKAERRSTELSDRWQHFCKLSEPRRKGEEFEAICATLLSKIEGFELLSTKSKAVERFSDLVVENKNSSDFWIQSLGNPILVECKLSQSERLIPTLYELIGRLAVARTKTVILFLASALTKTDKDDVSKIVKAASSDGKHVLVIDYEMLQSLIEGEHPDTALKLSYFSSLAQE